MTDTAIQQAEKFMINVHGKPVPESLVSGSDKLKDQTVRTIIGYAKDLSAQIARFKGHTFDDIFTMYELLQERYGEQLGGPKGNMQIVSYDGLLKVELQNAQQIVFGPELQVARNLIDRCIDSWAEGVNANIRALVNHAFEVDQHGKISTSKLLALRRLEIDDPQWKAAMQALTDSIRTLGSKQYIRFYERDSPHGEWRSIKIDLAAVPRALAAEQK